MATSAPAAASQRDLAPDAAGGAGDECHLAAQVDRHAHLGLLPAPAVQPASRADASARRRRRRAPRRSRRCADQPRQHTSRPHLEEGVAAVETADRLLEAHRRDDLAQQQLGEVPASKATLHVEKNAGRGSSKLPAARPVERLDGGSMNGEWKAPLTASRIRGARRFAGAPPSSSTASSVPLTTPGRAS
jgi:hypothetical protein